MLKPLSFLAATAMSIALAMPVQGASAADSTGAAAYPQPLPVEPVGTSATLPATYPDSWIFVVDGNFNGMVEGRVAIMDAAADTNEFKGYVPAGLFAAFKNTDGKSDFYVAGTAYSRITYGEKTDYLAIYDKSTLKPAAEVVLPPKRAQTVTQDAALTPIYGGKLLLVYNFTPAASITVVDMETKKVVNEVDTPGCALAFATGDHGFSGFCANGTLATVTLDPQGKVVKQIESKPFNDQDNDAMFLMPAKSGKITYFPTFTGNIRGIDFTGDAPVIGKTWSLVSKEERAAGWRPSGWQIISSDDAGKLYVVMQEGGHEGTHKDGGTEVWVFDAAKKQRIARYPLVTPAISVTLTHGASPLMVTSTPFGPLEVYDAATGKHLRSLNAGAATTAFVLQPAR